MINLIQEIIEKCGPRPSGSAAEQKAQQIVADKCRALTNNVQVHFFEDYLQARFGKLKYYCILYLVALAIYFFIPFAAFGIAFINALVFVLDFMMYRSVLSSFPGPKQKSCNIEATLEPQGVATSTLIFSGHTDSVYEFKWWYKLGQSGATLTVIAGILLVTFPITLLIAAIFPQEDLFQFFVLGYAALSPALVVYFDMHGSNPVDGACDNLSGVAIAYEIFKKFADEKNRGKSVLQNTRLKFVSFGCEETGLTGSFNYVEQQKEILKTENTHLINIDSIRLPEEVIVIEQEMMSGTNYSTDLINRIQHSFKEKSIPLKTGKTPIGGTDGVPFNRAGIPAVSIIGLSMKKLDPTYHTRRDTIENLNPLALENTMNGLVQFVKNWDSKK